MHQTLGGGSSLNIAAFFSFVVGRDRREEQDVMCAGELQRGTDEGEEKERGEGIMWRNDYKER